MTKKQEGTVVTIELIEKVTSLDRNIRFAKENIIRECGDLAKESTGADKWNTGIYMGKVHLKRLQENFAKLDELITYQKSSVKTIKVINKLKEKIN